MGVGGAVAEGERGRGDVAGVGWGGVTVGQYLQAWGADRPVGRDCARAEYPALAERGRGRGLANVEAGPLVRSSFEADRVAEAAFTRL